jgi:hypothetical protein
LFAESLDEDWEKDFDVEVTEQELEAAKERLKNVAVTQPAKSDDKVCYMLRTLCIIALTNVNVRAATTKKLHGYYTVKGVQLIVSRMLDHGCVREKLGGAAKNRSRKL